jgi:hypothetical protein
MPLIIAGRFVGFPVHQSTLKEAKPALAFSVPIAFLVTLQQTLDIQKARTLSDTHDI